MASAKQYGPAEGTTAFGKAPMPASSTPSVSVR